MSKYVLLLHTMMFKQTNEERSTHGIALVSTIFSMEPLLSDAHYSLLTTSHMCVQRKIQKK